MSRNFWLFFGMGACTEGTAIILIGNTWQALVAALLLNAAIILASMSSDAH